MIEILNKYGSEFSFTRHNQNCIVIKCYKRYEKEVLYEFFKIIGIKNIEVGFENHINCHLVDVYYKESITVSWCLWKVREANIERNNNSVYYSDFKNILKYSDILYCIFTIIEDNIV